MAITRIGSSEAAKLYSAVLFKELKRDSFFMNELTFGTVKTPNLKRGITIARSDGTAPIQVITDLKSKAGDQVEFPMFRSIVGEPKYGDSQLRGNEKALSKLAWSIRITQLRQAIDTGGKLTQKRTPANIRAAAREELRNYWSDVIDESFFIFLTGHTPDPEFMLGWRLPSDFQGWRDESGEIICPVEPVDTKHKVAIDGSGNVSNNPADATPMELQHIDKIRTYIRTRIRPIQPLKINSQPVYLLVIHPIVEEQLRTNSATNSWIDIQKMAGLRGANNPIFHTALGMYAGVLIVSHEKVPVIDIGGNKYAVNLFLGRQALGVAFGDGGTNFPFDWKEELFDYGNRLGIATSLMAGARRVQFDFGDGLENYGSLNFYVRID